MGALFPPWTNTVSRFSLVCLAGAIGGLFLWLYLWSRSPWYTGQQDPVDQPVQFDHRHHVIDEGIDCRFCHSTVETSPYAGMPSVSTCMGCHAQIWNRSPKLEPIRAAYFEGASVKWNRVHDLPDFVFFDHSIHVAKGVGCATCHGRVDKMAQVQQESPLTMSWCLECHREPARFLRPPGEVTAMAYQPGPGVGAAVEKSLDVRTRTSCTACHR